MIKILHIGDLHLGGKYPDKAAASIDWILEKIQDQNSPAYRPDIVVCTGDTTEKPLHVHSADLQPLLRLIHGIEVPIVFLQGTPSHEPYGFLENMETAIGVTFIKKVFTLTRPQLSIVQPSGEQGTRMNIAALPALNKPMLAKWCADLGLGLPSDDPADMIRSIMLWFASNWKDFTGPKILLGHWTVTGCATATGQTLFGSDIAVGLDDIALAGADAVLLGHIHKAQKWDSPVLTAYSGSAYPCNWGELDPKSFNVLQFNDSGKCGIQAVPYPHKPMNKIDIAFTGRQIDGAWEYEPDIDQFVIDSKAEEIKVCYSVPKEIASQVDDMYVRVLFKRMGIELAAVERTLLASDRERIAGIADKQTTRDQYMAVCAAKSEEPRAGALIKADQIDQQVVAA